MRVYSCGPRQGLIFTLSYIYNTLGVRAQLQYTRQTVHTWAEDTLYLLKSSSLSTTVVVLRTVVQNACFPEGGYFRRYTRKKYINE